MPYFIVLLLSLFFCSSAHSESFPFSENFSGFQWDMNNVSCPLEKEGEKLFTINLSSENKDYGFQINCFLQKEESKKIVTYVILEKSKVLLKEKIDESFKFEMSEIKTSFSDEVFSGYNLEANERKQHGFNKIDNSIFNSLLSLNKFHIVVNDKIENKEKYFDFVISEDSIPLENFEEFCSLDYFNSFSKK